jgi:ABC-type Fe3+/spermidine/putrescine transport system ATPase subunit
VIREGRIIQVGTPQEVYEQPLDAWAAALTGPVSALPGRLIGADSEVADSEVLVRPDWVELDGPWKALVRQVQFRGTHTDYELSTDVGVVLARASGPPRLAVGDLTRWGLHLPQTPVDHAKFVSDTP